MPTFVHPLWGYALEYPEDWVWREEGEVTAFAPHEEALSLTYQGDRMGHFVVRPELNPYLRPIEPLWTHYITRIGIMRGAKKVGASPLEVGNLKGYEAELLLPTKENKRLWVGLLAGGGVVLHLMVTHRKDEKDYFQPLVSRMVQSIRFVERTEGVSLDDWHIPVPPGYTPAPPGEVVEGDLSGQKWKAYTGDAPIAALQVFFLRELPHAGWHIDAYYPYPNRDREVRFASFLISQEGQEGVVALLPRGEKPVRGDVAVHMK
ncbi:MAG: hypothetical protein GXO55_11350 [Chloroflexi bacterium]|nr:hypothetical protein [Chloroflexota bacterium]